MNLIIRVLIVALFEIVYLGTGLLLYLFFILPWVDEATSFVFWQMLMCTIIAMSILIISKNFFEPKVWEICIHKHTQKKWEKGKI